MVNVPLVYCCWSHFVLKSKKEKKNLLIFQVSEILEGEIADPQFTTWLHKQGSGCWKGKKRKEKRKRKKAAPAGDKLCLGSWARRHFPGALALASGQCLDS